MSIQKAILYFNLNENWDSEDLEEEIEARLFEIKNFFLSKIPVQKLFESRLVKLNSIVLNAEILGFDFADSTLSDLDLEGENVREIYANYQKEKQKFRLAIFNSQNPIEISVGAKQLIQLEKVFASKWYFSELELDEIIVSKEPDPMIILQEIKKMEEQGHFSFEDYKKSQNSMSQVLLNEMKRLSLLSVKY